MIDVVIPELGESITEGTISEWHVREGDVVAEGQPLVSVDTDKVSVDIPAPAAGVVKEILAAPGNDVPVGAVIARIEESAAEPAKPPPAASPEAGGVAGEAATHSAPAATAPAPGPERPATQAPPPGTAAPGEAGPAPAGTQAPPAATPPPGEPSRSGGASSPVLSPAVRRMVREYGVDPGQIEGTGRHGRITPEDVRTHAEARSAAQSAARSEEAPTGADLPPPVQEPVRRRQIRRPMTRLRRAIARRLKEVQNTAAILTTFNEIDMSAVIAARKSYGERFLDRHGVKLGFMSFFVKATVEALKAFPVLNAFVEGDAIVYNEYYDIGVAVSTDRGLVVPVLRDADRLSFAEIEKGIAKLAKAAREGTLSLEQLKGGTFSITNGGVFGSLMSTPILNPPQSGILGMHRILDRPVAVEGRVEIRPMMYVALSYDHRIVDGREAVRFLVTIKEILEDPTRLFLEV